jgi:hypothetical protein
MPTKPELKHIAPKDEAAKAPHRRRSKPAFDVPDVAGEPGAPAGWVYRDDAKRDDVTKDSKKDAKPAAAPHHPTHEPGALRPMEPSNRLLSTGIGLLFVAAAPVAFVSLLAIGLVAAPFALAKAR